MSKKKGKCTFKYCKDCHGFHNFCRCDLYKSVPNYCPDCGREAKEVKTHKEFWDPKERE